MEPEITQEQKDDDFSGAFAQFATETPAAPAPEAVPAAAEPAEPAPAEEAPAEEPPAEEEPAEEEPAAEPSASDDELLARLAALVKKTPAADKEPETAPAAQEEPVYSTEEQEFLTEYEKDWPDVAKAEALRRRSEYRQLVNHVFSEVAKELAPLTKTLRTLSERAHLTDIYDKVDDYDDVREKVVGWVDKQPTYLQNAYKHVIQQGTPDEIADLVSRYKQEVGTATPSVPASKKETELPTSTKQAVAALAPVSSKRSTIVQADDPNDFNGAFEQFAKSL